MSTYDQPVDRPGCVTAYAILLWLGGALCILSGLIGLITTFAGPTSDFGTFSGLFNVMCLGVIAFFPIATGIGIWKMRMWGWRIVVILNSIGVTFALLSALIGLLAVAESPDTAGVSYLLGAVIGLAINGVILYWFLKNRALFSDKQTVTGPDGELSEKAGG